MRGGAFNNEADNVRAAVRNRNWNDNNIGFRLVVSTFFTMPEMPGGGRTLLPGRGEEWQGSLLAEPARRAGRIPTAPCPGLAALARGQLRKVRMYARLCSFENLLLAYRQASRARRSRPSVAAFEYRLEEQLVDLRAELLTETYRPGRYKSFFIHEPKRRLISAAPFRDRVVHHALCNLTEPLFEATFVADSWANRVGKGTHRALDSAQSLARRHAFVLQCDVRQFFPSIDHEILLGALQRKITDPAVRRLMALILRSGEGVLSDVYDMAYFPGDDLFAANRPRGLPIGNLTSQFWANVYMNAFDHFVKRELRCSGYVRYVDDLLLFADDKPTLWAWRAALVERLGRLRLRIHAGAHPRPVAEGFPFLGFTVFPLRRRLKRRKAVFFRRRLRRLIAAYRAGVTPMDRVNASVRGWVEHARHGNTVGLRKAILYRPLVATGGARHGL